MNDVKTEWFAGFFLAGVLVIGAPAAVAQDPDAPAAVVSPFAEMSTLSEADMNNYAGGSDTVVFVEQGTANVNATTALSEVSGNAVENSTLTTGSVHGNMVASNSGFTTVVNNSGNMAGIAVNTNVIINLNASPAP